MNKIYITILIITLGIIGYLLYNKLAFLEVVVKFEELEPLEKQMNVYYKGFKVGKSTKIYPDKDYKHTYLKLKLFPHDINLPNNITANIKKRKTKEYISLLYPESPSLKQIKENDVIKGDVTKDINSLLNEAIDEDEVDLIIDKTSTLLESANNAIQNLNNIFVEVNNIVVDSKNDIKVTTKNLSKTSENLRQISAKLNESLDSDKIDNSIENVRETTENIKEITNQIDKVTIPIVNSIACDGKEISNGVKTTLKERMGLIKLLFGKPIKRNCN